MFPSAKYAESLASSCDTRRKRSMPHDTQRCYSRRVDSSALRQSKLIVQYQTIPSHSLSGNHDDIPRQEGDVKGAKRIELRR